MGGARILRACLNARTGGRASPHRLPPDRRGGHPAVHGARSGTGSTCATSRRCPTAGSASSTRSPDREVAGPTATEFNAGVVEEFRANGGHGAGPLADVRLVLVHHVGARSGVERVVPLVYFPTTDGRWMIIASNGGVADPSRLVLQP